MRSMPSLEERVGSTLRLSGGEMGVWEPSGVLQNAGRLRGANRVGSCVPSLVC